MLYSTTINKKQWALLCNADARLFVEKLYLD